MGLDRDDTIIRRRLRQKLEFLVEDAAGVGAAHGRRAAGVAADAPRQRSAPSRSVAFRQVYLSRSAAARRRAPTPRSCSPGCAPAGPDAATDASATRRCCPPEQPLGPLREVARTFGEDFAAGPDEDRAGTVDRPGRVAVRPAPRARARARRRGCAGARGRPAAGRARGAGRAAEDGASTRSTSGCSRSTRSRSRSPSAAPSQAAAAGASGSR